MDEQENRDAGLFIHPGGLGDVCLSESTMLSLTSHFGAPFRAVGTKRVLDLFGDYFTVVESLDRRKWAYLFSDSLTGRSWPRVVFVGKDRSGLLRRRLRRLASDVIFIDMYPDRPIASVEEYQIAQLGTYGITPKKKRAPGENRKTGFILYPERPYRKSKWPVDRFLEVYRMLQERGGRRGARAAAGSRPSRCPHALFRTARRRGLFFFHGWPLFLERLGHGPFRGPLRSSPADPLLRYGPACLAPEGRQGPPMSRGMASGKPGGGLYHGGVTPILRRR